VRPIHVKKADLLAAVRKNREQHRAIFLEAVEGYRKEVLRLLEERVMTIKHSKLPRSVSISLYVPEDHTKDYDNAIAMFEMSIDEELEIDEASFVQLVRDDWQWKRQWLTSNAGYSNTAAASLQAGEEED
jgi:hypothetical protein